jgi:hypothetical protein
VSSTFERLAFAALVLIGTIQMIGDLTGSRVLKGIGAATTASPQPKVFTAQDGFETYASRFWLSWLDAAGERVDVPLDQARYDRLAGPYNRRNAYGAIISYAPVLQQSDVTRPMLTSALEYALCRSELLAEMGLEGAGHRRGFRLEPRDPAGVDPRWRLDYLINCKTGELL